jgi:hypothetical protein
MANSNFPESAAGSFEPGEQLGVDHRSVCFKRMALEKIGAQELERAVDIAHAQDQPDNELPTPGIELAHPGILALYAITNHSIVRIDQGEKALQFAYIKLAIRIHKKCQIVRGSGKAIGQGRSITLIMFVREHTDAPVQPMQGGEDSPGVICAAIIDYDHLKVPGQVRQFAHDLLDGRGNDLFFVIGRENTERLCVVNDEPTVVR